MHMRMISFGKLLATTLVLGLIAAPAPASARVVYRCVQGGTVSLATAPEPGSKCTAQTIDDNSPKLPNLWGMNGTQKGLAVDDNFYRLVQVHSLIPEVHPFVALPLRS